MGVWQDFKDRVKTGFVVLLPGGASWAVWDAAGNVEVTNDGATVQDLILDGTLDNTREFLGIPNLNDMDWEAIGTGIGNAIAAVLEASGGIIGGVGKQLVPNLIEGVEIGYDKIREKLDGQESNVIAAFTVGFLVIFTFAYAFYEIRRGK